MVLHSKKTLLITQPTPTNATFNRGVDLTGGRGGGAAGQWSQQETNVAGTWQTIGQPSDNLFLVSCTDISRRGPRRILGLLPPPPTAGTATCSFQFLL